MARSGARPGGTLPSEQASRAAREGLPGCAAPLYVSLRSTKPGVPGQAKGYTGLWFRKLSGSGSLPRRPPIRVGADAGKCNMGNSLNC